MFLLRDKLFYDTFRATERGNVDRVEHIHPQPRLAGARFFSLSFFLLKVKSPSESRQLLVGISISAAVEADYMGVVPHTGSDMNLPQSEETIMMLLIDAFICVRVHNLDSSSCPSTACATCAPPRISFLDFSFKKKACSGSQAVQQQTGNEPYGLSDDSLIVEPDTGELSAESKQHRLIYCSFTPCYLVLMAKTSRLSVASESAVWVCSTYCFPIHKKISRSTQ